MKKLLFSCFCLLCYCSGVFASKIVASVDEQPITDTDVNARIILMKAQGQNGSDLKSKALDNIISDYVKISYANQFRLNPSDSELNVGIREVEKSMNREKGYLKNLLKSNGYDDSQLNFAVKASLSWQNVLMKTVVPMIDINENQIDSELKKIAKEHGLPVKLLFYKITGLSKQKYQEISDKQYSNCMKVIDEIKGKGGYTQKIEALHYELDSGVRNKIDNLKDLSFSKYSVGGSFFVCKVTETDEYVKFKKYVHQGIIGKDVMAKGDQILKNQVRKAVVVKK